jgi:hypothetical protein
MLTVVCVRVGTKYGREYELRLRANVARCLTIPHRFVSFTDDPLPGVESAPVPPMLEGWWAKLWLFSEEALRGHDRILYLDLDTVFVGNIDEIALFNGEFAILRDFYRPDGLGSAVMLWSAGEQTDIWDTWLNFGAPKFRGGDQAWIEIAKYDATRLQDIFPGRLVSYKADCDADGPPKGSSIVCFHGKPDPHEVEGWAAREWRGATEGVN